MVKKKYLWLGIFFSWLMGWLPATPLQAAGERQDSSDLFVWIFLLFCALIVVAQLIPAALVLLGFIRGARKEESQPVKPAPEAVDHVTSPGRPPE